jgi:hypothetical protein
MVDVRLYSPMAAAGMEDVLDVAHCWIGVKTDVVAEDLCAAISVATRFRALPW